MDVVGQAVSLLKSEQAVARQEMQANLINQKAERTGDLAALIAANTESLGSASSGQAAAGSSASVPADSTSGQLLDISV